MNKCTTIEERAKAFCENNICVTCGDRKNCNRKCLGTCIPTYDALEWLIQFGKSEREELTRWRDPKEELPLGIYRTRNERYIARYSIAGKIINLGTYKTIEEAQLAYKHYENEKNKL